MASLAEYLNFGPGALLLDQRRRRAKEAEDKAKALLELQRLVGEADPNARRDMVQSGGFNYNVPAPEFTPQNELDLSRSLAVLGQSPQKLAEARVENIRADMLDRGAGQIEDPAQLVNAGNRLDASPVRVSGGVAYNRFDTGAPMIQESGAQRALTDYRDAQAADQRLRTDTVRNVLNTPGIDPLIQADVANKRTVGDTERVKVRRRDGSEVYMDARLLPTGRYEYTPASDDEGPLRVPASAKQQDFRLTDAPITVWRKALKSARSELARTNRYKTVDPQEAEELALQYYRQDMRDPNALPPEAAEAPAAESSGPETERTWNGQVYRIGQVIPTASGNYEVVGFYPDGEPDVRRVR